MSTAGEPRIVSVEEWVLSLAVHSFGPNTTSTSGYLNRAKAFLAFVNGDS